MNTISLESIQPKSPYSYCVLLRPEFIIKSNARLSDDKLQAIVEAFVKKHQLRLFNAWKALPENAGWHGDVSTKQRELLRAEPLPNPCILESPETESILKETLGA